MGNIKVAFTWHLSTVRYETQESDIYTSEYRVLRNISVPAI
jgi:hypothetical protein